MKRAVGDTGNTGCPGLDPEWEHAAGPLPWLRLHCQHSPWVLRAVLSPCLWGKVCVCLGQCAHRILRRENEFQGKCPFI